MASVASSTPIPSYSISRIADLSLQFDPPVGSLELANALSLRFPLENSLSDQIRCALLQYIELEKTSATSLRSANMQPEENTPTFNLESIVSSVPKSSSSSAQPVPPANLWDVTTGMPKQQKRKKTKYEPTKRRKVATVRKHGACPFHRAKKIEVWQLPKRAHKFSNSQLIVHLLLSQSPRGRLGHISERDTSLISS